MKGKRSLKGFLFIITIVTILSGIAAYVVVDKKNGSSVEVAKKDEVVKEKEVVEKLKSDLELDGKVDNILDDAKNIYIQNPNIPSNLAEVNGVDKSFIEAKFKSLNKNKISLEELNNSLVDLNKYKYQINLVSKNIKINLYKNPSYVVVEVKDNVENVYSISEEQMSDFIDTIQNVYIDKHLSKLFNPLPTKIYINSRDENSTYILSSKEAKDIISKFKIISLEDGNAYSDVAAEYPDYNININRDNEEYKFHLINDEIMIIETPIIYLYCKYDQALWDYVEKKLPGQKDFNKNDLRYLFKAEKIVVNDIEGVYSIQDDDYYNIMIPRWINKGDNKELQVEAKNIENNQLRFNIKFLIEGKWEDISIYDNHIIWGEKIYFSKNIGEAIKSLLMMP